MPKIQINAGGVTGPSRGQGRVGEVTRGPTTFGRPHRRSKILSTPECVILKRKVQKFSPQSGPTRMFPWAPLWLSTGLDVYYKLNDKTVERRAVLEPDS